MLHRPLLAIALILTTMTCARGTIEPPCGDGFIEGSETCDDENQVNGDGCDETCQLECGNTRIDAGETCDDGNRDPDDGCDSNCKLECGNGELDGSEECEYTLTENCAWDCTWSTGTDGDADIDADADADADGSCDDPDIEVPESGRSLTIRGELDGSSDTWHRPIGSCTQLSGTDDAFPMDGYVLVNRLSEEVTLIIDALASGSDSGTLSDSILFLYTGPGLPDDALDCAAANDDGGEGRDARLEDVDLAPGQCLYLVVSSFYGLGRETAEGSYELVVTTE